LIRAGEPCSAAEALPVREGQYPVEVSPMRRLSLFVLILAVAGCGGGSPSPVGPPNPTPAPTPAPTATPNPFAAACGTPLPPMEFAYGIGIKVQLEPSRAKKILNGSPAIRNRDYCEAAGFLPNTLICNTRKEDHPERVPCDHYLAGIADNGKPGPNWYQEIDGKLVKCDEPGTTCSLKPENQYLLDISAIGKYVACSGKGTTGTCGDCIISTMARSSGSLGGLCGHE
jgi:hypothetical protein